MQNRMKMKRRNRAETQSGNEESEEGRAAEGRRGDKERGRQGEKNSLSPYPLVSPSLRSPRPRLLLYVQLTPSLCASARLRLRARAAASVEGEAEFESCAHAHRLPILNCGMKAYFLGRLDGCLGQSIRQPANRADVVGAPVGAEDDGQHNRALDFVQTGVFGVFGFLTIEDCRFQCFGHDGDAVARSIRPATN